MAWYLTCLDIALGQVSIQAFIGDGIGVESRQQTVSPIEHFLILSASCFMVSLP